VFLATEKKTKQVFMFSQRNSPEINLAQDSIKNLLHSLLIMIFYHSNLDLAFATHGTQVHGKSKNILIMPIIGGCKK